MNKNYATIPANNSIQTLLEKGAQVLYDKYLNKKLPLHTHYQNNKTFYLNLNLNSIQSSQAAQIENATIKIIQNIPVDSLAPKRLILKKQYDDYSTLSPKNTLGQKSTKYGTAIFSQRSSVVQGQKIEDGQIRFNKNQHFSNSPVFVRNERPSTMQNRRSHNKDGTNEAFDEQLQLVEEKRAATCHTRKRKQLISGEAQKEKFVKIEEIPLYIKEEMETTNRLRRYKKDKLEQQAVKQSEKARFEAIIRRKQMKAKEQFQSLKRKLKGKGTIEAPLTNFESLNGEIKLNGRPIKRQSAHVVHLQFNPQDQKITKTTNSCVSGINNIKKKTFSTSKSKKKIKMTNQQFTNNGLRQISSIPFVNLSYGIALSEDSLAVSASRRRRVDELTRTKFHLQSSKNKFKSHIPEVNSARVDIFASIEQFNQTARSELFQENYHSLQPKQYETTLQTHKQMQQSILWRPRARSENKKIRISNREVLNYQILQSKFKDEQ